jgi:twitching motility protein PilT
MTTAHITIAPIEHLVQALWDRGGTDIHLTRGMPPQLRIDGSLVPAEGASPLTHEDLERTLHEILTPELEARLEAEREVDFSFSWLDRVRFRANAYHQQGSPALALRAIPQEPPTPEALMLPPAIVDFCNLPQGLVLVTGPTGSGKSTTQAALVNHINQHQARHILTLEDPIEYVHAHKRSMVNQREIGLDTPTFAQGLRSALREDPDVLLVGEMRDTESIQTTLTIAETGHLVLATLHTNDASTALDRIVDVFPPDRQAQIRVQLASSLVGVVAQRLLPRTSGGLVAAFEVLLANGAARNLIRDGKTYQVRNIIAQSVREGMQTLEQSLSALVSHGVVGYDDAVARALVPKEVRSPGPVSEPQPVG